jgi:GT2 family glycosyltransferase/predicted Zn-dependent protease
MSRRHLFGPTTPSFAYHNLEEQRQAGCCLAFDPAGATNIVIGPSDTWEEVCHRLPQGWQPDFVVLYLPYTTIPACLWTAPVPLIGLAADWQLQWHSYRRRLRCVDLILTDTAGVEALARAGISHARAANLFGCPPSFVNGPWPEGPRDIDIYFAGNSHGAVQRERLPWLGRLARLGERWRVQIDTGIFGADYRQALGRARIAFNRSIRGESNLRVMEAVAAGALLFQEADNREVPAYFRDGEECVFYTDDNLEARLTYFLEHEEERARIAAAARAKVQQYTFPRLWDGMLDLIEQEWPALTERARQRPVLAGDDALAARMWEALGSQGFLDPALAPDLGRALVAQPHAAGLHHALGLAVTFAAQGGGPVWASLAEQAAGYFRRALDRDPGQLMAGLSLVEALMGVEQKQPAIDLARQLLATLDRDSDPTAPRPTSPPAYLDAAHFPPVYDLFRVEWERAAWSNASQPAAEMRAKHTLLRWRLHTLLADLTGEVVHFSEAAVVRPDLPPTRAALGCALARNQRFAEAVPHLRAAVAGDPFDRQAAQRLFQALGQAGDGLGQRRLARDRRLLSQAAPRAVPPEEWFLRTPPPGDELASIIILCCNELDLTRACLESLRGHTRPPYEVILVNNGSTDGTPAFLEEVRSLPGPERVVVIHNETNRGFPAGCNQGLAQAHGRYLIFLNNDTVIPQAGWLERLIACALHQWPHVGMAGPVTNCTAAPQQIPAAYHNQAELEAFSARRRQEYAGQALEADRLTGFCLLARREVLDRLGGFDEGYGLGFFDDDDLCLRARKAGFKLLVALDVFIHHVGSRTFAGLGIDCHRQLADNHARFRAKWGDQEANRYHLPEAKEERGSKIDNRESKPEPKGAAAAANGQAVDPRSSILDPRSSTPKKVSLCIIAKNEEANLPACLESVGDLFAEIIVADTGSTDGTKEVAQRLGAKVVDFPWVDSFAAARNAAQRPATGDFIFWMDCDERLDAANRQKLRDLFGKLNGDNLAVVLKCLCLPDPVSRSSTAVDHVRLFRNHPELTWSYRVHEQIVPALNRLNVPLRRADVVIHHVGYQDPAVRRRKRDRDRRLLQLELAENPDDPFMLFNLGWTHMEPGEYAEALPFLQRSLERSNGKGSIVHKVYALLAQAQRELGRPAEALATCQQGRLHCPDDPEIVFQEGLTRNNQKDYAGAEACWLRVLATQESTLLGSIDTGLRGYKARSNLAVLYRDQGRLAEAEAQWQAALAEQPDFDGGALDLGRLYQRQGRWAELEALARRLEARPAGEATAANVRAQALMTRGDVRGASYVLDAALARHPRELGLWMLRGDAALRAQDWVAAAGALRQVLELNPEDQAARDCLTRLLQRPGRGAAA